MHRKQGLVPDGTEFIGSNLANHCAADNEVVVLDGCYLRRSKNLNRVAAGGNANGLGKFADESVSTETC